MPYSVELGRSTLSDSRTTFGPAVSPQASRPESDTNPGRTPNELASFRLLHSPGRMHDPFFSPRSEGDDLRDACLYGLGA